MLMILEWPDLGKSADLHPPPLQFRWPLNRPSQMSMVRAGLTLRAGGSHLLPRWGVVSEKGQGLFGLVATKQTKTARNAEMNISTWRR
jgi:hypothetical protein